MTEASEAPKDTAGSPPSSSKLCVGCRQSLKPKARVCPECSTHQCWIVRNGSCLFNLIGKFIGGIVLCFSLVGYLISIGPDLHRIVWPHAELEIKDLHSAHDIILHNKGNVPVYVSHIYTFYNVKGTKRARRIYEPIDQMLPAGSTDQFKVQGAYEDWKFIQTRELEAHPEVTVDYILNSEEYHGCARLITMKSDGRHPESWQGENEDTYKIDVTTELFFYANTRKSSNRPSKRAECQDLDNTPNRAISPPENRPIGSWQCIRSSATGLIGINRKCEEAIEKLSLPDDSLATGSPAAVDAGR